MSGLAFFSFEVSEVSEASEAFGAFGDPENRGDRGSLNTALIDVIQSVLASSLSAFASKTFVFPSFFVIMPAIT